MYANELASVYEEGDDAANLSQTQGEVQSESKGHSHSHSHSHSHGHSHSHSHADVDLESEADVDSEGESEGESEFDAEDLAQVSDEDFNAILAQIETKLDEQDHEQQVLLAQIASYLSGLETKDIDAMENYLAQTSNSDDESMGNMLVQTGALDEDMASVADFLA